MNYFVRRSSIAALAISSTLLISCGAATDKVAEKASEKIVEEAVESQTGADVDIDTNGDGSVKIETEDGSYSSGTGKVPEQWPTDLSLPEGLTILSGTTMDTDEGKLVTVGATSKQSATELLDLMKDQLSDWTISGETTSESSDASIAGAQWDKDGRRVNLMATFAAGSDTSVTIAHTTLTQ